MRIKQARHDDMGSSVDRTVERMFVLMRIKAATWHLSTWHGHDLLKDHEPLIMAEISISIAYAHHGHAQQAGVRFLPVSSDLMGRLTGKEHAFQSDWNISCWHLLPS